MQQLFSKIIFENNRRDTNGNIRVRTGNRYTRIFRKLTETDKLKTQVCLSRQTSLGQTPFT